MIESKVILDSIAPTGVRLTTLEVTFHRFVLSEFNTHRVFSRNSASSRAIPVEKQLKKLLDDPAFPCAWTSEQSGMQGGIELQDKDLHDAKILWDTIFQFTMGEIEVYLANHPDKSTRLHKSLLNRLLEPFMWHTVIVTSSYWDNFWGLRCNPQAQPEIKLAAEAMREAYNVSVPTPLGYGEWHTPYIRPDEYKEFTLAQRKKISAARCARVSYLTHDGVRDIFKDIELYERLVTESPPHASPLEHVATPAFSDDVIVGNFLGWHQLRHWSV